MKIDAVEKSLYDAVEAQLAERDKEIERLNRVIVKELTENDELGCEYTYVNVLRQDNNELKEAWGILNAKLEKLKAAADGLAECLSEMVEGSDYDEVEAPMVAINNWNSVRKELSNGST